MEVFPNEKAQILGMGNDLLPVHDNVYRVQTSIELQNEEDKTMDCKKILSALHSKKTGFFAAGVLFGTAGVKLLASKDAKKVYTNCTAAILRAKESLMKTAATVQENAEDIYAEAQQINEDRMMQEETFENEEEVEKAAEEEA